MQASGRLFGNICNIFKDMHRLTKKFKQWEQWQTPAVPKTVQ